MLDFWESISSEAKVCQVFLDHEKMHEEDLLGPTFKIHSTSRERTSVATCRRGMLFTFFIHLCDCCRAPNKYSCTMQPSILSISHIGRSFRGSGDSGDDGCRSEQSLPLLDSHLPNSGGDTASCTVTETLDMINYIYKAGGTSYVSHYMPYI